MKRAIVICSFGDRGDYLHPLLRSLREHAKGIPIVLISNRRYPDVEDWTHHILEDDDLHWKGHPRWPIRNTNLWLAKAALWEQYDSVCCLNDDMFIMHKGFVDGFTMAEKFGVCVPTNPRIYVKYNAMGADTTEEDRREVDKGPIYAPACNVSPMFVCRLHDHAKLLIETYIEELHNCMRGTLAFWLASWHCAVAPIYLPEQWCVGQSNAAYFKNYKKQLQGRMMPIEPIILHYGQSGVRNVFKDVTDVVD
jgi:hypothetical protein